MRKSVLDKVGGFCNEMKYGMWYDDDDFLSRIQKVAQVKTVDSNVNMGIHQYHNNSSSESVYKATDSAILRGKNHQIYQQNIRDNTIYCNPKNEIYTSKIKLNSNINEVHFLYFDWYNGFYEEKLTNFINFLNFRYPYIFVNKIPHTYFSFGGSDFTHGSNKIIQEKKSFFENSLNHYKISNNILYISTK